MPKNNMEQNIQQIEKEPTNKEILEAIIMEKENKVNKLIDILLKRNLLSDNEVKEVMSMEPFAKLFV